MHSIGGTPNATVVARSGSNLRGNTPNQIDFDSLEFGDVCMLKPGVRDLWCEILTWRRIWGPHLVCRLPYWPHLDFGQCCIDSNLAVWVQGQAFLDCMADAAPLLLHIAAGVMLPCCCDGSQPCGP